MDHTLVVRARRHAALGDPIRLAIIDELQCSDRAPSDLARQVGIGSNLLAHHLDVLEEVGLITRSRSSGDGRKRYVHLELGPSEGTPAPRPNPTDALFVCTHNSARSQLAAALWQRSTGCDALSAGTEPASVVHPLAVKIGRRHGLDLESCRPRHLDDLPRRPQLVITVCDRAHEALDTPTDWLHWSVPDPVPDGTETAFERVVEELRARIERMTTQPSEP